MKLDERMKKYEYVTRHYLMCRTPVIVRIDGKAFHTFTKGMKKPFDHIFMESMQDTMKYLCENVQGCVLGYCQSDEISLLLIDYDTFETSAWFDNNLSKIISITSSLASVYFNQQFSLNLLDYRIKAKQNNNRDIIYENNLYSNISRLPIFDSRAFNLQKEEVNNYFVWRQQDAIKNAIQMIGRAYFTRKELENKSGQDIVDMLDNIKVNYHSYTTSEKRGTCCIKTNKGWELDTEIPIFKEDKDYIEKLIYIGE
jgi:hypothetical protein|nr:MAG TPA: tRNAHis guanylyltransferase [Ackermannviridae sp.]DAW82227.1 MAG TPA: tRNAHis guanylyltransferase [Bacteriophage sp.]